MPTEPIRFPKRAEATVLLGFAGLAGFVITLLLLYPGQYPFDSAYQWWQARTGEYANITPVAMPALWSVLLAASASPASLLVLNLLLFWTGLVLAIERLPWSPAARIAALLACGLVPTTLVQLAHLLTDSHLAAVLVLACGLFLQSGPHRRWPLALAAALLVHAGCIRHNAVLATLPLAVALVAQLGVRHRTLRAGATLAIVLASLLAAALLDRWLTVERRQVWPTIALWDLAAISVSTGDLLLPDYSHGPGLSVAELVETRAFDPTSVTNLFAPSRSGMRSGLESPYPPELRADLRTRWFSAIAAHPRAWIAHRLRTFWLLVGPHHGSTQGIAFYVNRHAYRDNPALPEPLAPRMQQAFYGFAARLVPGWAFSALPWLLLHAISFALAWRHRASAPGAIATAIAASALLYTAGYLVLAPSAELRYLTWPLASAPLALALGMASHRAPCAVRDRPAEAMRHPDAA